VKHKELKGREFLGESVISDFEDEMTSYLYIHLEKRGIPPSLPPKPK
jgi:hypothetical protein